MANITQLIRTGGIHAFLFLQIKYVYCMMNSPFPLPLAAERECLTALLNGCSKVENLPQIHHLGKIGMITGNALTKA